ncbi:hypothetical protein Val02_41620 [Virgisporangium aliadipatigenens]|uniref:Uncharacterized protein n=1 Tax=Virgisporangium aliadipatigenens TaxID=741659 RepID=A0A8J4DRP0_9ACTN|nr:hypothetical protein [Virgisporangium aliadipatigenens]GIJ47276.1 hypothetical protein Val02_41620 [Virgisporangium aliadipatigenens]
MYDDDILDSGTHRRPSPLAFALAAVAAAGLTGGAVGGLAWMVDYAPASTTSFDTTTGFDPGSAQVDSGGGPSASSVPAPIVGIPQSAAPDPALLGTPAAPEGGRIRPEDAVVDERDGRPAGVPPVAVPAVPVPEVPVPVPADAVPTVPDVPDFVPTEPVPNEIPPAPAAPATVPWTGNDWQDPTMGFEPAPIETTRPQQRERPRHFEDRDPEPRGNPLFHHWFFQ